MVSQAEADQNILNPNFKERSYARESFSEESDSLITGKGVPAFKEERKPRISSRGRAADYATRYAAHFRRWFTPYYGCGSVYSSFLERCLLSKPEVGYSTLPAPFPSPRPKPN